MQFDRKRNVYRAERLDARAPRALSFSLPGIVAHADWSVAPSKRWVATAVLQDQYYEARAPKPVDDSGRLLESLLRESPNGRVLIGFDFPIGLPLAFARQARITRFLDALPAFGTGEWSKFYERASAPEQISLRRPFYPASPGGRRQEHLWRALGLTSMNQLRRRCELPAPPRRAASPLFWTLGAQQVGAAALTGWREILVPAIGDRALNAALWPFAGDLQPLLTDAACVIAEAYPADAYVRLRLPCFEGRWSKRRQADRRTCAPILHERARDLSLRMSPQLQRQLLDGFGTSTQGEDPFDAVVGLVAMLQVVTGEESEGTPPGNDIRDIEGWILGQPANSNVLTNS